MRQPTYLITEVDEAILRALARFHYLTAAQASRLLYPNLSDDNRYMQRRLKTLVDNDYALRLRALPVPQYGQAPHVFTLARRGRQYTQELGIGIPTYFRPSEEKEPETHLAPERIGTTPHTTPAIALLTPEATPDVPEVTPVVRTPAREPDYARMLDYEVYDGINNGSLTETEAVHVYISKSLNSVRELYEADERQEQETEYAELLYRAPEDMIRFCLRQASEYTAYGAPGAPVGPANYKITSRWYAMAGRFAQEAARDQRNEDAQVNEED